MSTFAIRSKTHWGTGDQADDRAIPFRVLSAATTNAQTIIVRQCLLTSLFVVNTNASARFLKIYDTASTPIAGSGTPIWTLTIPGSTTGAGFSYPLAVPVGFNYGIGLTITGAVADNDTTVVAANEVVIAGAYI